MGCGSIKEEILLEGSKILKEEKDKEKLKEFFINKENQDHHDSKEINMSVHQKIVDLKLLFQARRDCVQNFHVKCNKKAPIVILIQVRESKEIFGLYLSIELDSPTKYTEFNRIDPDCFLFSLTSMKRYEIKDKKQLPIQIYSEDDNNFLSVGDDIILSKKLLDKKNNIAIIKSGKILDHYEDLNLAKTNIDDLFFTVEELEVIYVVYLLREKNEYYIE